MRRSSFRVDYHAHQRTGQGIYVVVETSDAGCGPFDSSVGVIVDVYVEGQGRYLVSLKKHDPKRFHTLADAKKWAFAESREMSQAWNKFVRESLKAHRSSVK